MHLGSLRRITRKSWFKKVIRQSIISVRIRVLKVGGAGVGIAGNMFAAKKGTFSGRVSIGLINLDTGTVTKTSKNLRKKYRDEKTNYVGCGVGSYLRVFPY